MNHNYSLSLFQLYKHPLFRGATPRIPLATFGGAMAGGLFDYFTGVRLLAD